MSDPLDKEWALREAFATDPRQGCELLFRCYYTGLCSHAVRFVYSRQVAEDLVGEVFATLWQKQLYQQIKGSYRAYLFAAVRNRAVTYLRWEFARDRASTDASQLEDLLQQPSPEQMMQYDELYGRIRQTVEALSPQSRKVFLMSRFEGKPNKEIAEELSLSIKTVEAHMTKALHALRKALKGEWLLLVSALGATFMHLFF
ncbi:RNA polymerase sigma-70 factor, ECF subfamily [Catalinimonas alkaloidigena]|uniref:RNA polymerase sigma-70 factor, ECF subfamily n=2 Tax=Catalinimonas alkaloidigena TaxID=1075417 RepID=A0A1G9BWG4_9BACT|nr:RNA polymerase sigma-70 factor, ECF subfamily [Catalinimonas alkaloidigena]